MAKGANGTIDLESFEQLRVQRLSTSARNLEHSGGKSFGIATDRLDSIFTSSPLLSSNRVADIEGSRDPDGIQVSDGDIYNMYANVVDGDNVEVSFSTVQNVPVFPGCERGNNEKKRKCMSEKIAKFVQRKFNTDLAGDLGLTGRQRISVIFKIDKSGNVTGVRARAPHPRLEKEAQRVINLLPKMQPGKQRGKAVIVPYSLPIIFQVQD